MRMLLMFLLLIITPPSYAQLSLVADGTSDFTAHEKYCSKIVNITQDTVDNLARSLQVSSNSIGFRNSRLNYSACCVTLDTPKGPINLLPWLFYKNEKGEISVRINTANVDQNNPACNF
jgi:hypothetical protein